MSSHDSLSLLFMMKVMVWHFVNLLSLWLWLHPLSCYFQIVVAEIHLQVHGFIVVLRLLRNSNATHWFLLNILGCIYLLHFMCCSITNIVRVCHCSSIVSSVCFPFSFRVGSTLYPVHWYVFRSEIMSLSSGPSLNLKFWRIFVSYFHCGVLWEQLPLRWCIFSLSMVLKLMEKVQAKGQVPSVIAAPAYYLLHIVREGITFLACARSEMSPLLGIEVSLVNFYSMLLLPSCLHSFFQTYLPCD